MRTFTKPAAILVSFFFLLLPSVSAAQTKIALQRMARARAADALVTLGTAIEKTALDCSHFVNSLFEQAGLPYDYQPSRSLYRGTTAFKRVYRPVSGDLIVWPGHVGIVVDPADKTFVSALRRGVKVAAYTSRYWRRRGRPHFFRYSLPIAQPPTTWQAADAGARQTFGNAGME